MYTFKAERYRLNYSPEWAELEVDVDGVIWKWKNSPYIVLDDGEVLDFKSADLCVSSEYSNGVSDGVRATYSGFISRGGRPYCLMAHTYVAIDKANQILRFEIWLEGEEDGQVAEVAWPAAFEFNAEEGMGYSILSRMQGALIPAKADMELVRKGEKVLDRPAYMPIFGQVKDHTGYLAIFDTCYDTKYNIVHERGKDTTIEPLFIPSLEKIGYRRIMLYVFEKDMDYVKMAHIYRQYVTERGRLVTLRQKADKNPNVAKLLGTPIVHEGIAVRIHEKSHYYHPGEPEKNDHYKTFASLGQRLENLYEKGVKCAYLHLDGWGKHGYDNLHPDPFPPHEDAGGAEGMKALSKKCRELGYIFGIHDQYRDYYYDAPTFSFDNAIMYANGEHPYCEIWYGGPHSYLCQALAPEYVRRNYAEFEKLGIKIEGAYLDVFSVVAPDECFAPSHRLTREGSVDKRNECFEILNTRGIIPSSEEAVDPNMVSIALCHHAPYFIDRLGDTQNGKAVGINIPLLNLVYHDCIVIPWEGAMSKKRGGWGCPADEWCFLHALLNGGTVYLSPEADEEALERMREATELHKRVGAQRMMSHEFLSDNFKKQRTVFEDGTEVVVDFENETYEIIYS